MPDYIFKSRESLINQIYCRKILKPSYENDSDTLIVERAGRDLFLSRSKIDLSRHPATVNNREYDFADNRSPQMTEKTPCAPNHFGVVD